jgi:hypothetical protein
MGTRGELGEVVFSRPTAAAPLHSELPLLISAVALGLPPLLEGGTATRPTSFTRDALDWAGHAEATPGVPAAGSAVPRLSGVCCPACKSNQLVRSRSRWGAEKIRKHMTPKRIHRCARCGWRGWMLPSLHAHGEATLVKVPAPVDLNAIDVAIAATRYELPLSVERMMGQIAFRQSGLPISPNQRASPR